MIPKRISDKIQEYRGKRFYLCGFYFANCKVGRLHRIVWRDHFGEIPEGFHVHHKDEDRSNNRIDNLELIEAGAHVGLHSRNPTPAQREARRQNALIHARAGNLRMTTEQRREAAKRGWGRS